MDTLIHCAFKALRSLLTPKVLLILAISIAINLLIIIGLGFLIYQLIFALPFMWLQEAVASVAVPFISGFVALFFFPLLLPLIISFFSDAIASAIEQEDYPAVTPIDRPFWQEIRFDLLFTLKVIGINLLIIPLYLIPGINLLLYYSVNGYLIGSEFFSMAARRHIPLAEVKPLRQKFRGRIFFAGGTIIFATAFPVINLISPIWGMALMVHLHQEVKKLANQPEVLRG